MSTLSEHKEVLAAFSAIVHPTLLGRQLPSALRLFAHLTLLSSAVGDQAGEALARCRQSEKGILGKIREDAISRSDEMRSLNLNLRKAHLRTALSNPKGSVAELKVIGLMLDSYFPSLPNHEAIANNRMLFINYICPAEVESVAANRAQVRQWLEAARMATEDGKPWPKLDGPKLASYTKAMHTLAEETITSAEELEEVCRKASEVGSKHGAKHISPSSEVLR